MATDTPERKPPADAGAVDVERLRAKLAEAETFIATQSAVAFKMCDERDQAKAEVERLKGLVREAIPLVDRSNDYCTSPKHCSRCKWLARAEQEMK
jgi:hypothetical protein